MSDALSAERLRAGLDPAARAWVRDVHVFDRVESTNDVLKDEARRGAPEGLVAVASVQTAGRGRHGRQWVSPPGNLFLSVVLRPARSEWLSLLPLAAGVAVAEALEAHGAECRLKWPNDVLAGGRKLAGLLAEASSDANGVGSVVLGIGANVALRRTEVPEEIADTVTSLREETGRTHDVADVAASVLGRWVLWYDALQVDQKRVREAWRARAVDWWGRTVEVLSGGTRVAGVVRDLDETGGLVLETADGTRTTVISGEARELRRTGA